MAFLAKNNMNFSQAFSYGIEFCRIDGKKAEKPNFTPQNKDLNASVFFNPADK